MPNYGGTCSNTIGSMTRAAPRCFCKLCEASDTAAGLQSAIDEDGSVIRTKARPQKPSGVARAY